jgi:hypothetical protein
MPRPLPTHASLEALKKQAKSLLKSRRQQEPEKAIRLQECQHLLAQDYGFKNWSDLKKSVLGRDDKSMLHVSWSPSFRDLPLPGGVVVWRDPLIDGPAPVTVDNDEWLRLRAGGLVGGEIFTDIDGGVEALRRRRLEGWLDPTKRITRSLFRGQVGPW